MSNTHNTRSELLERTNQDYPREQVVTSLSNPQGIRGVYAGYLLEPVPAKRCVVSVTVRHCDEVGSDYNVAYHFYVDTAYPISQQPVAWAFAGPTVDLSGNRVELLFVGDELALVTVTKIRPFQADGPSDAEQSRQG